MASLEPPDSHILSAALGWLGLGNLEEAEAEMQRLSIAASRHPEALEFVWLLQSRREDWTAAAATAKSLKKAAPDQAQGWIHYSYALRRAEGGGLKASWKALLPAYEKFPAEPVIPYNLACYACQMNRLEDAREWLGKALKIEEAQTVRTFALLTENLKPDFLRNRESSIKNMALQDEDLKPLWKEIQKL